MREFVAETGGRYTYVDDVINLQDLALSMTSIFDACSNFIISGCNILDDGQISPGYVWLNGKVRHFYGTKDVPEFPYYIIEYNYVESSTYANEVNKRGRITYECYGSNEETTKVDYVTGLPPQFIEITKEYAPRLIDKFIGRYAVLLDSPFNRQTINKELHLTGKLTSEKEIESLSAQSVLNTANGYSTKSIVRSNGDISIGAYKNGKLVNEIVIRSTGSFSFYNDGKEIGSISEWGGTYNSLTTKSSLIGSINIEDHHITNMTGYGDEASVAINYYGYKNGDTFFRDFEVYNGKSSRIPIFKIYGRSDTSLFNGSVYINKESGALFLSSTSNSKSSTALSSYIQWRDKDGYDMATVGFFDTRSFDYLISNLVGNIRIFPTEYVNIIGDLKINDVSIRSTYVDFKTFTETLKTKVDCEEGKQLTTIDFTVDYQKKLDSINKGDLSKPGDTYAITKDVVEALDKKLSIDSNLKDLSDVKTARGNLQVYSTTETDSKYLKVSGNLIELISLSADEINGLTSEEVNIKKEQKQEVVRRNLNAEKKGTGDLKLAKAHNLSDLNDLKKARTNLNVYSIEEIDKKLERKLSIESEYSGVTFTADYEKKLNSIKSGNFVGVDVEGNPIAQIEGYVTTSQVLKELNEKANLLLDGYNESQKTSIAANINVYTKNESDAKYAVVPNLFQDYITYLVKEGKSTDDAQKLLREKLNTPSNKELTDNYVRKDAKLSDLVLANVDAKKNACKAIGAAYADEYQTKIADTGWLQMNNSGSGTDTRTLFVRQIGNVVCIQGTINTAKRDGSNWGGTVAIIPSQISPPKYGLRVSYADFNDGHKHNRGASFTIKGNSRSMLIYESGWYNATTEIHFSYMT